ncbi:hypothetical protein L7F22_038183 [Adiantum nelumboides]|nr:hypothetical protein [Adiantum nelumboides]
MESEYEEEEGISSSRSKVEMGMAGKALIMAGSLGLASIVGVYVHPHLLPLATEGVPQLWRAAQSWMTAPILFLLLNVVVGTLYVSKRLAPPEEAAEGRASPVLAPKKVGDKKLPRTDGGAVQAGGGVATRAAAAPTGLRARLGKSRTLSRLVRSKSEQIPPISAVSPESSRLKKAVTTPRSRKQVVVVADPPDDGPPPAGHEEVDKKAEDFISRFYHKVKLQRLDSLLRQQQQQALQ